MFALKSADLGCRILDCGGGPAAFNAELTARGGRVISADPLYGFSTDAIRERIRAAKDRILENTRRNRAAYRWDAIPTIQALETLRMTSMERFLADYPEGLRAGRYRAASLPDLPFADGTFDLVLCSHFLFTYSDTLDLSFHVEAVSEMARVGREVRIFPLLDMDGKPSPHLAGVTEVLTDRGFKVRRVGVPYEFQRGGHKMLALSRR